MEKRNGFSLIELLIVIAILGTLLAIAMPAYTNYVMRAKIPDATSNLAVKKVQMEQFFQDNGTYVGGTGCTADSATSTYFDFSCVTGSVTANTYTLQAVGKGSMANFVYTVNQDNAKTTTITGRSGWAGNAGCWVTNTGGAC